MPDINLFDFDLQRLQAYLVRHGEPKFRASQVLKWMYHQRCLTIDEMLNLSQSLRLFLKQNTVFNLPECVQTQVADCGTIKWLMRLSDNQCIETVFIPEKGRGTLCISSQVGCTLNCRFCATGAQGFQRNLSTSEIIGQVWQAVGRLPTDAITPETKVTNIVFMGMGEPLLNYKQVLPTIRLLLDDFGFGLSKYRVTLSTAGVVPVLERLREDSEVALAVSLHAPNNALRDKLVPLNKKYPLEQLIPLCERYFSKASKRHITMEYVMLDGINDEPKHAKQLIKLLQYVPAKVNLIPFNPYPNAYFKTSPQASILRFHDTLMNAGIQTLTRKTRGDGIEAACGQLAGEFDDRTKRRSRSIIPILEKEFESDEK